ncbi:S41 family peptidase [Desulfotomaculum sp. 1211_IL3151]|uniref:S41 family peptidase n=1 Tax=Desulfotomaculum sp. 1211_IL3151 TaxID=3084055 RepID=UPI002FDAF68F
MLKRLLVILSFGSLLWTMPAYAQEDEAINSAATLGEVFGYISQFHLAKPDTTELANASIKGMLDQLKDPYTVYFSPGELDHFSDELNGDFEGIGAELEMQGTYPKVVRLLEQSPAQQAGLQTGDIIQQVDGQDIAGQSLSDIVSMLRGTKGTTVTLTVKRAAQEDFQVSITRNTVHMPTVFSELINNKIGYIAIDSFGMDTGMEFGNALIELTEKNAESLIIDLRNNGGGYVDSAAEIAAYLLGKDETIFITEDRNKRKDSYSTEYEGVVRKMPLVVLINGETASASEILAGALQDYGMATLLGTNSYGKGTVQDIIPLGNGGALKMTTAEYLTPKGRRINGTGLRPDRTVVTPALQLHGAIQLLQPEKITLRYGNDRVSINDKPFTIPGPQRINGEYFVPLRPTMEALGYQVHWENNGIVVTGSNLTWQLPTNGGKSMLNGQPKSTQPLFKKDTSTYLSLKDLSLLECQVQVQGDEIVINN